LGHLHPFGNRFSVLHELLDHQLNHFLEMLEGFLLGIPPCDRAIGEQGRIMGRPPIIMRFNHYSGDIGLHVFPLDVDGVFVPHNPGIGILVASCQSERGHREQRLAALMCQLLGKSSGWASAMR
jgi:hypothetical protein